MIVTETEAATKLCVHGRGTVTIDGLSGPIAIACGNSFPGNKFTLCIASKCMAWRIEDKGETIWRVGVTMTLDNGEKQYLKRGGPGPSDTGWEPYTKDDIGLGDGAVTSYIRRRDHRGYCGLAGKP